MKITALALVLLALLFLVGWTSRAERPSKTDWEYKAVTVWQSVDMINPNMNDINNIGDDGWELVTIIPNDTQRGNLHQTRLTYYFKRPL